VARGDVGDATLWTQALMPQALMRWGSITIY
jgi:hypothetical protein